MPKRNPISALIAQQAPDKAATWQSVYSGARAARTREMIRQLGPLTIQLFQQLAQETGGSASSNVINAVRRLPDATALLELPEAERDYRAAIFGILNNEGLMVDPKTKQVIASANR